MSKYILDFEGEPLKDDDGEWKKVALIEIDAALFVDNTAPDLLALAVILSDGTEDAQKYFDDFNKLSNFCFVGR